MNWTQLVKEVGPYLGLMFFFIWRDYRREEQLVKQVMELQKFVRDELMDMLDKTTEALKKVKK